MSEIYHTTNKNFFIKALFDLYPGLYYKEIRISRKLEQFLFDLCPKLWTWENYTTARRPRRMCYQLTRQKRTFSVINW